MPFDDTGPRDFSSGGPASLAQLARLRRVRAVALWRRLLPDRFTYGAWQDSERACALGWLARKRHDGWYLSNGFPRSLYGLTDDTPYEAAAAYFGLRVWDAALCFGQPLPVPLVHGRLFYFRVTAEDVCRTVLGMPVDVAAMTRREPSLSGSGEFD